MLGPQGVVGPEAAQLDHRGGGRVGREAIQDGVEGDLLLGLVMASKPADDLGHPGTVVAAREHYYAVVHHLHACAVALDDLTGASHLRDRVGVAHRDRQIDAPLLVLGEVGHPAASLSTAIAATDTLPSGARPVSFGGGRRV